MMEWLYRVEPATVLWALPRKRPDGRGRRTMTCPAAREAVDRPGCLPRHQDALPAFKNADSAITGK